jgi:hypothetical protein
VVCPAEFGCEQEVLGLESMILAGELKERRSQFVFFLCVPVAQFAYVCLAVREAEIGSYGVDLLVQGADCAALFTVLGLEG